MKLEVAYRVYLIAPDGQIFDRIELACEDDDTAKERARWLAPDCRVELWKGDHMIAGYEH
jgi:hypothetical protein